MIEDAIENPERQYKTEHGKVHYKDRVLKWVNSRNIFVINSSTLELKWERVPKPVDFMTALKAYNNNGKTIVCELDGGKSVYRREYCGLRLVDKDEYAINALEILEGEWYIED